MATQPVNNDTNRSTHSTELPNRARIKLPTVNRTFLQRTLMSVQCSNRHAATSCIRARHKSHNEKCHKSHSDRCHTSHSSRCNTSHTDRSSGCGVTDRTCQSVHTTKQSSSFRTAARDLHNATSVSRGASRGASHDESRVETVTGRSGEQNSPDRRKGSDTAGRHTTDRDCKRRRCSKTCTEDYADKVKGFRRNRPEVDQLRTDNEPRYYNVLDYIRLNEEFLKSK
jgi:hypothetical protein